MPGSIPGTHELKRTPDCCASRTTGRSRPLEVAGERPIGVYEPAVLGDFLLTTQDYTRINVGNVNQADDGIAIWNLSFPEEGPVLSLSYGLGVPYPAEDIAVVALSGGIACVAEWANEGSSSGPGVGLEIADVSDSSAPRMVASVTIEGGAVDLVFHGDTAYVAMGVEGVAIVDLPEGF